MNELLTIDQAYRAMYKFVDQYQARGHSRDILLMLHSMLYDAEAGTNDPATWEDWMDCVAAVQREDASDST
ncbi:MAG: hypothetical protein U0821_16245 [Chloroflexota bacterium]